MTKRCPNCGGMMRAIACDVDSSGRRIVIYACDNKAMCGAIVRERE